MLASDSGNETDEYPVFEQSCVACEQRYTNRKAWRAHLNSRNHAQKYTEFKSKASVRADESNSLSTVPIGDEEDGQSSDEEQDFNPRQCLFCNIESPSIDSNTTHMSHAHSFFIPNAANLIDLESLLSYLFTIISVFHECLFCGTSKSTRFAVQDHMRGKGHCKVDFGSDEHQLSQFYDFTRGDDEDEDGEGVELEVDAAQITVVPDEDELRLPSGKTLGHRSRARFFRQNHRSGSTISKSTSQQQALTEGEGEGESDAAPIESKDQTVALRAGTSTSLIGVPQLQLRALVAVEKKMEKMEAKARNEYQSGVERGGNRQKRYRVAGAGKKQGGLEKVLG